MPCVKPASCLSIYHLYMHCYEEKASPRVPAICSPDFPQDMAKVRGQLLRDIAALTTFGEGAEGYRDGDEDNYEDGTNARLAQYNNGWINGGDEGGDGTWVVEGEEGKSGSGASTGRSRLRMERAMDFVDEDER